MSSVIPSTTSSTSGTSSTSAIQNGRYWGLASGLDVDSIVTALVSKQQTQIDKANQSKQIVAWQQSAYQSITGSLNTFMSTYLDPLASNSMLNSNTFSTFTANSSNSAVTATAHTGAANTQHTIDVTQSAVAGSVTGKQLVQTISGTKDDSTYLTALAGTSFGITVDGVTKTISFGSGDTYSDGASLVSALQSKIDTAFGISKVTVSQDSSSGNISFAANSTYSSAVITLNSASTSDSLAVMGITSGASNRYSASQTLSSIFGSAITPDANGDFSVTINGASISLNLSDTSDPTGNPVDTLNTALSKINSSNAGATASYSYTTGKISIVSNTTGADTTVQLTDSASSGFFTAALGSSPTTVSGEDAMFTLDGTAYTRKTNNFTIDSIAYSINSKVDGTAANPEQDATISMSADTGTAVKAITDFVSAYNTLFSSIYSQIMTKPDSNYPPLTDTQKSAMKDTEITAWNQKAQAGLLFGDDTLNGILTAMTNVVNQSVTTSNGKTISLYDIGISVKADVVNGNTLQIDTDKLTQALQNDPSSVQQLFTQPSTIFYDIGGGASQSTRQQQEGFGYRLQDIINNATQTGVYPYCGSLIRIAGTSGDTSTDYELNAKLKDINADITKYTADMKTQKDQLYTKFSKLETLMEQMNTQSSMISSFASSGS